MYGLTTLKGVTVPRGYSEGTMDTLDAYQYLYGLGMYADAYSLLTLKGIQVMEGNAVAYTPAGHQTIYIPEKKGIPINLGNDSSWGEFVDFVNDPTRNKEGKWAIIPMDEYEPTRLDPKNAEELARAYTRAFYEALGNLDGEKDAHIESALGWVGLAMEYISDFQDVTGNEHLANIMRRVIGKRFGELKSEIIISRLGNRDTTDPILNNLYKFLHKNYGERIRAATELVEGIEGGWSFSFITAKTPSKTRSGGDIEYSAKNTLHLSRNKTGNKEDLILALALSQQQFTHDALDKILSGRGDIAVHEIGLDATGLTTGTLSPLLGKVEEAGEAFMAKDDVAKAGILASLVEINYHRTQRADFMDSHTILNQLKNLEAVEKNYLDPDDVEYEDMVEFLEGVAFTTLDETSHSIRARLSQGIDAVTDNITEPIYRSSIILTERGREVGHRFMFTNSQLGKLEKILGEDLDTQLIDEALLDAATGDHNALDLGRIIVEKLGMKMGEGISIEDTKAVGKIAEKVMNRVRAREEFYHLSVPSRLSLSYVKEAAYGNRLIHLAEELFGADSFKFDEYSMGIVGTGEKNNGRVLPMAALDLIGSVIPVNKEGRPNYVAVPDHMFRNEYGFVDGRPDLFDYIITALRKSGEQPSSVTLGYVAGAAIPNSTVTADRTVDPRIDAKLKSDMTDVFTEALPLMDKFRAAKTPEEAREVRDNLVKSLKKSISKRFTKGKIIMNKYIDAYVGGSLEEAIVKAEGKLADALKEQEKEEARKKELLESGIVEKEKKTAPPAFRLGGHYGSYFEPVQIVSTAATLIEHTGGAGSIKIGGKPERNPYDLYKNGRYYAGFSATPRITWKSDDGITHVLVPSHHNTGAVDASYLRVDKENKTIDLEPLEYKIGSGTHAVAHIGNTDTFANLVRGASDFFNSRNLNMGNVKNISLKVAGVNKSRLVPEVAAINTQETRVYQTYRQYTPTGYISTPTTKKIPAYPKVREASRVARLENRLEVDVPALEKKREALRKVEQKLPGLQDKEATNARATAARHRAAIAALEESIEVTTSRLERIGGRNAR